MERAYYDDGALRAEGALVDRVPHGLHRHWHPNGVLAMEVPYDHGSIDGMVKQWNDKGELIGSCEIKKGTGVHRMWHPNGRVMGETSMISGKWTGRQLAYFDDGELAGETYWMENEKVSKKRYREACKRNPDLPRYEDEPRSSAKSSTQKKAVKLSGPSEPLDELPLRMLRGPGVREALSWLEECRRPSRSLGEARGQDESIRLVKKLYGLGAVTVQAVEIDGKSAADQNSGRVIIELPPERRGRRKLLKFCGILAQGAGFDPDLDVGQRYLLLMLD